MTAPHNREKPIKNSDQAPVSQQLVAMAEKGFDRVCLNSMQDAAYRFAAQTLQHNASAGAPTTSFLIRDAVDQRLGGSISPAGVVRPGHIAAYMNMKVVLGQVHVHQAMHDADAIARMKITDEARGRPLVNSWLSGILQALKQHADRLSTSTPIFAAQITQHVERVKKAYADPSGLENAMALEEQAVYAAKTPSEDADPSHIPAPQ